MKPVAIAALSAVGAAALWSALVPEPTPEHELLRVRRRRNDRDDGPDRALAADDHILRPADARKTHKIDAGGDPLVVWIELPAERGYLARKQSGAAIVRSHPEAQRDGSAWFAFEFRTDGDAKIVVTSRGRVITHFLVQAKNVGRSAR